MCARSISLITGCAFMNKTREKLYRQLASAFPATPIHEIKHIDTHDNRVFAKEEYLNPTGSHYDRVFLYLLWELEKDGIINPDPKACEMARAQRIKKYRHLIETTTGNAGASFAWLCRILGYEPHVVISESMPSVRHAHIQDLGGILHFSQGGRYAMGTIECLTKIIAARKNTDKPLYCTDHSRDDRAIIGMKKAGREIINYFREKQVRLHYFVAALGSGVHLRGIGEALLEDEWTKDVKIIGVEPFECPDNFLKKYGEEEFRKRYRIPSKKGKHELLGTGSWLGASDKFVHAPKMRKRLEDIMLIQPNDWKQMQRQLIKKECKLVGRTSAACLSAALCFARKKNLRNKNFLIIFYDHAWKYLNMNRHAIEKHSFP